MTKLKNATSLSQSIATPGVRTKTVEADEVISGDDSVETVDFDENIVDQESAGKSVLRLVPADADLELHSIVAPSPASYKRMTLMNASAAEDVIVKDNTGATATNRFFTGAEDYILQADTCVDIIYDVVSTRWRVIQGNREPAV